MRRKERMKVLVADRRELFREALVALLQKQSGIELLAACATGLDAIRKARELSPDVVILDTEINNVRYDETTRQIIQLVPNTVVLILTHSEDDRDLWLAIEAGATGYMTKDVTVKQLLEAISGVKAREAIISAPLASALKALRQPDKKQGCTRADIKLTAREHQVLNLIANSASDRDIAKRLNISEHTAKVHTHNIMRKLQVHSRVAAATWAIRSEA